MTRFDLSCRLRMLKNQLQAGEIDPQQYRLLRRGAGLAYRLEQPRRRAARRKVQTEREAGRLERPAFCEGCGAKGSVHGHHPNHDEALQVTWLCRSCHIETDHALGQVPAEVGG